MRTYRSQSTRPCRAGKALSVAAVLGLGALLGACGPASSPGSPTASAPSPGASSPSGSTEAAPSSVPTAADTPSATPVETPLCTAATLTGALDASGGGAAGSIYMKLTVTNTSGTDCIVDGYPGVSMVKAGSTQPIGAPAQRSADHPSAGPITLAPGSGATAVLQYTQADNYQGCQREQADSVLVYPPSATDSLEIAHPLTACSNTDIVLLHIGAFAPQA